MWTGPTRHRTGTYSPSVYWLAFGTYDTAAHPRVAALIEGVRAHGYEVVELNEPLGLSTAARVRMLHQPWRVPQLGYRLARCWTRLTRRARAVLRAGRVPDVVLVGYLGHFDVLLARRLFPGSLIVLDQLVSAAGTAADRRATGRLLQWLLRALDRAALRRADIVVLDTEANRDRLPPADPRRARVDVVVPVGATAEWFTADGGGRAIGEPLRVLFFGLFTPLQGVPVIAAAAAQLADDPRVSFTLVGRGQDYEQCRSLAGPARISWLDWVPGDELPALTAAHDVCLGIFGDTGKGRSVVPTKVFQGAAAGCAIVTSDTPPQRAALGDAAQYVPPGDPGALAATLRGLAGEPELVAELRRAAQARARESFTGYAVTEELCRAVVAHGADRRAVR